jgi:hypothetical protein
LSLGSANVSISASRASVSHDEDSRNDNPGVGTSVSVSLMYATRVPDGVEVETRGRPDTDLGGAKASEADAASAPAINI